MICPNFSNPAVKEKFDALVAKIGEDAAYNAWYLHDGNVPRNQELAINNKVDNVKNAIKNELPIEISNAVTVVEDVPLDVLGRNDLFLSLKEILNAEGIEDELLINWLGINKDKYKYNVKDFVVEIQIENLIQSVYNQKKKVDEHPELQINALAKESFSKWVTALEKYPVAFQDAMLTHAIKYLNPSRRSKYVLQLSDVALQNAYGIVVNKPYELNRIGKLYDQEVLKTVSDAVGHEPSASGKGYWVHVPRTNKPFAYESFNKLSDEKKYDVFFEFAENNNLDPDKNETHNSFIEYLKNVNDTEYKTNIELLRKLSPSTWCTAGGMTDHYVQNYDNYLLIVDGITVAGIEAGKVGANGKVQVKEVTSRNNNGVASIDYLDDTIAFFEKHNLDTNNESLQNAIEAKNKGKVDGAFIESGYNIYNEYDDRYDWNDFQEDDELDYYLFQAEQEQEKEKVSNFNTVEEVLDYIQNNNSISQYLKELKSELKENELIANKMVELSGYNIIHIDRTLPFYKELAHKAVQSGGHFYEYISQEAKQDPRNIALHEAYLERVRLNAIEAEDLPFSKTNTNKIQGYYDPKTDKVVVVANNTPVNEAAKIAIHEVAHRGMLRMAKELGGEAELFQVLLNSENELMKKLPELLKRTGHTSLENLLLDYGFAKNSEEGKFKLLQELSARWAETLVDKPKPTWWKNLLQSISNWITKFTGKTLNENEVNELVGGFVKYGSEQDTEQEYIPSFKPKPSNTLSLLKQEEFKSSLTVGEKAQPFLYWSETTSKQVAEKGVIVDKILNDRFEGRYVDTDEERTFKFANVIDESLEREMTRNQQKFYKSTLVLGETIDVETQQETYRGEVVDIGEDEVQIQDANGAIIAIPYNIIFKPNAQMKLAKVVQKLKQTFSTQLAIYRRSPKSAEQQKRIESYETILKTLEDYNQIEDFTVFLEETNKALFRAKAILDRVVSPDNIESNEKKLYVISYVKDLLNSFKNIKDLSTIIEDFEGSDILKGYMEDFNNRLATAETAFKDVAIPQLGSLLWDYYDPRLNDKMVEVGLDPYTKQRLIDELSDPSRDIDFFNQVFVAPSNVNDVIMGLFVKMIKGGKEQARLQDAKFLVNIVPLIEKVKKKYGHEKFKEILKTFYKIVPVTEERDGKEVIINTREFIKQHDYTEYFQTVKEFKRRIDEVQARKVAAESALMVEYSDEMNQERLNADGELIALKRARAAFYNEKGRGVSDKNFKKTMDTNFKWDLEIFYDDLKGYYTQVTDPDAIAELDIETSISIQNDVTGEIEHYVRNERLRSEPNPEKYVTDEWAALTGENADQDIKALLVGLIDEYNAANRKLPYNRRIKDNKVPCIKKQDTLKELKSIWDKITKAISEGKFFSKAYAKIREEVRAFLKTGSPQHRRRMDGKPYREIPIGVTSIMDVEDSSDDIIMSTLMFVREANNFSYMNNFVGSSEVIIDVLSIQDPLDEDQKEGVEVEINRRKEALLSFFKQQIYGEFNTTHGPLSKTIDFLGKATALTTIGLNPKSWLANFFVGNWNNLAEGFGGRFYTISDIMAADKQFMKMLWNEGDRKKLMNMIDSLDAIQGRFSKTFGAELMSFKEKYGRLDTLFIGQDLAEIQIQGSAMLAMLKSQGITIPEDGIFTEENTPNLQNFKNLLHAINKRNHGVYNDFDRLHFQTNAVFRLFLQFRKWVVSTFRARYSGAMTGEYRIDIEMGSVEKGWYRLFYEYFRDSFKNGMSLVEAIKDINNPNVTAVQREGIRRTAVDFIAFVIGSALIFALKWDDDDEEDFVGEYFIIYYLMRMVSDIGVYLPFLGFSDKLRMVANPFGASSTIKDIIGLFGTIMDFEVDKDGNVSIFKEYQRDTGKYEKGDLKVWGKMSKLNTASNLLEITDPKQLIENFEAASRV